MSFSWNKLDEILESWPDPCSTLVLMFKAEVFVLPLNKKKRLEKYSVLPRATENMYYGCLSY
jgi:hypothetical protein